MKGISSRLGNQTLCFKCHIVFNCFLVIIFQGQNFTFTLESASFKDLNLDFRVSQFQRSQEYNRKEVVSKVTFCCSQKNSHNKGKAVTQSINYILQNIISSCIWNRQLHFLVMYLSIFFIVIVMTHNEIMHSSFHSLNGFTCRLCM